MNPEVVTIGETMVVFEAEIDGPLRYVNKFYKRHGGAESNVAIGVTRLGHTAGWISRVGDDELGKYLVSSIRGEGVDTTHVTYDNNYPTSIYLKERLREGSTQVYYYRKGSAASQLNYLDFNWDYIKNAKIIHLTGITPLLSESCLEATRQVAKFAKENDITLSFDPNLRFKLIAENPDAKDILLELISQADVFMPGLDEAEYLFGTTDYEEIAYRFHQNGGSKICIKNGSVGTYYSTKDGESGFLPSYKVDRVMDPVGAGDGFAAGILSGLLEEKELCECVKLGAKVGAMVVTVKGDIEGLPCKKDIETFHDAEKDVLR